MNRVAYLDRIKVLCTVLVILHHLAIAYGGSGDWFYNERQDADLANILLSMFTAVNQSFFMGLFFFISGYFTPMSYDRRGGGDFIKQRLIRFGIPLIFFTVVVMPLIMYVATDYSGHFYQYVEKEVFSNPFYYLIHVHIGPLWFVEALLIFSIGYVIYRKLARQGSKKVIAFKGKLIFTYVIVVWLANFLIRLVLPLDVTVLSLKLGYFPAYIGLFIGGIVAYRCKWLNELKVADAKKWLMASIGLIFLVPVVMVLGGALEGNISAFNGGLTWQSLIYSMIDPVLGLGISYCLLVWYRERSNTATDFSKWLSSQAYTVYILHALTATYVSFWLKDVTLYPLLKFALVGLIVVPITFVISYFIRLIPFTKKVL
ncbi:acyltransferase family protein [Pseudoneobacillus sp. C159]